jgi:hypothetical protein
MTTPVAAINPEEFTKLIEELTRVVIPVNYDRMMAGKGRSQAFGIIRRWSYRPYLSRNTWQIPKLWALLQEFAANHVPIGWDGVTVNDCYVSAAHKDKGNEGHSYTVSFGEFTGGELCIDDGSGGHVKIDTRHTGYLFNGAGCTHWTAPFVGRRFCLVFYKIVWPPKFLPRYKVTSTLETDGTCIVDDYDESIVVVDKKGHVVRIVKAPQPRGWIGRLTSRGQKSQIVENLTE